MDDRASSPRRGLARRRLATARAFILPLWLAAVAPLHAQGLPAAQGSFVQLQLSGCGTTTLSGQGTIDDDCIFNIGPASQGTAGANGSNLGGILRGNALAAATGASMVGSTSSAWDDRFTFQGGVAPATAMFQFHLFGLVTLSVEGPAAAVGAEVDYRASLRPVGSWGGPGSSAGGSLGALHNLQTVGPPLNTFHPVAQTLQLEVSLAGIGVGNSLDLATSFLLRSQASAGSGGTADVQSVFFNSAGLADLRFFDALGADITPQVQYTWQWGTQFVTPVPEPAAPWLAAGGLAAMAAWRRRAKRARAPRQGRQAPAALRENRGRHRM